MLVLPSCSSAPSLPLASLPTILGLVEVEDRLVLFVVSISSIHVLGHSPFLPFMMIQKSHYQAQQSNGYTPSADYILQY